MSDYISREDVKKLLWERISLATFMRRGIPNAMKSLSLISEELEKIPAADVRPVKRGTWMIGFGYPNPTGTYCLKCGFAWSEQIAAVTLEPVLSRIKTNFCPNCGADMRPEGGAESDDR